MCVCMRECVFVCIPVCEPAEARHQYWVSASIAFLLFFFFFFSPLDRVSQKTWYSVIQLARMDGWPASPADVRLQAHAAMPSLCVGVEDWNSVLHA